MRFLCLAVILLPAAAYCDAVYSIEPEVASNTLRVAVRMDAPSKNQGFQIPAWCPGFYTLRNFEEKISDVRATDSQGYTLAVNHPEARTWDITNAEGKPIVFSYRVLGDDPGLGFFQVSIHKATAFVNGPSAFMYPIGHLTDRFWLRPKLPTGWHLSTAMADGGEGKFVANGYDEFIDHPIQMGIFETRRFTVGDIPFEVAYVSPDGTYAANLSEETEKLRKYSAPAIAMMRGTGFQRYLYIIHLAEGNFGGGLEHRASTTINIPNVTSLPLDDLAAHEYFHAWNVKQIRPKVLGPFDYTQPCRTGNLWFAEGVTDYYAYLTAYRSGQQSASWILENFSFFASELQESKVAREKTLEEVCRGTWETGGFGDRDLSYYTKGSMVGLILDCAIRESTEGKKSLDDVMRTMWAKYRLPKPGYDEDGIRQAVNEVTGTDLSRLYDQLVRSKTEMPWDRLHAIGLRFVSPKANVPTLGFSFVNRRIVSVEESVTSGLKENMTLVSVDGKPYEDGAFSDATIGKTYTVVASSGMGTVSVRVTVQSKAPQGYRMEFDPFATASQLQRQKEWLAR